jgi:glycosyltransferase involved in cell wall biosynthesis
MLRVAVDATPLLGTRTGVGVFVDGLLGAIADHDFRLSGYGLTWAGRKRLPRLLPDGVDAARTPMPAGPLLRMWSLADHPSAEWWTGPVDVVHGTNFVVPPTRRAARVVTVHDLTAVRFPELCTPTSLRYPDLVRRAIAGGSFVHTPSAFVAAEVVDGFGADPDRVSVIHHGVDAIDVVPVGGPPMILALGTVEPRKDLPVLVRAFDGLADSRPDLTLVIAGPDGWGADALAEEITVARHGDRIHRQGWIDDHERARLLGRATVFAYPSRYEGFGLPAVEAMSAGVPVVATAVGAIPEVVGDAALLSDPGDVDGLAANLGAVLDDEGCRRQLVERGRARAAQFTWAGAGDAFAKLYGRAAESR